MNEIIEPRPTTPHAAVVARPDSVTHYVCPGSPDAETHHIGPSGHCKMCGRTVAELMRRYRLAALT